MQHRVIAMKAGNIVSARPMEHVSDVAVKAAGDTDSPRPTENMSDVAEKAGDTGSTRPMEHVSDVTVKAGDTGSTRPMEHVRDTGSPRPMEHVRDTGSPRPMEHVRDTGRPRPMEHVRDTDRPRPMEHVRDTGRPRPMEHVSNVAGKAGDTDSPRPMEHVRDTGRHRPVEQVSDVAGKPGDTGNHRPMEHLSDVAVKLGDAGNHRPMVHVSDVAEKAGDNGSQRPMKYVRDTGSPRPMELVRDTGRPRPMEQESDVAGKAGDTGIHRSIEHVSDVAVKAGDTGSHRPMEHMSDVAVKARDTDSPRPTEHVSDVAVKARHTGSHRPMEHVSEVALKTGDIASPRPMEEVSDAAGIAGDSGSHRPMEYMGYTGSPRSMEHVRDTGSHRPMEQVSDVAGKAGDTGSHRHMEHVSDVAVKAGDTGSSKPMEHVSDVAVKAGDTDSPGLMEHERDTGSPRPMEHERETGSPRPMKHKKDTGSPRLMEHERDTGRHRPMEHMSDVARKAGDTGNPRPMEYVSDVGAKTGDSSNYRPMEHVSDVAVKAGDSGSPRSMEHVSYLAVKAGDTGSHRPMEHVSDVAVKAGDTGSHRPMEHVSDVAVKAGDKGSHRPMERPSDVAVNTGDTSSIMAIEHVGDTGSHRPMEHVPDVRRMEKFTSDAERLATFIDYPITAVKRAILLALSGFIYIGDKVNDKVQCCFCSAVKESWRMTENVDEVHRSLSPGCPMVNTNRVNNSACVMLYNVNDRLSPALRRNYERYYLDRYGDGHSNSIATSDSSIMPSSRRSDMMNHDSQNPSPSLREANELTSRRCSELPAVYWLQKRRAKDSSIRGWFPGSDSYEKKQSVTSSSHQQQMCPYTYAGSFDSTDYAQFEESAEDRHSPEYNSITGDRRGQSISQNLNCNQSTSSTTRDISSPKLLANSTATSRHQNLGFPRNLPETPKHPEFALHENRVASYLPGTQPLLLDSLAKAGFYSVRGDFCRCFFCGIELIKWKDDEDPFLQHAQMSGKCPYIRGYKGPEFVEAVRELMSSGRKVTLSHVVELLRNKGQHKRNACEPLAEAENAAICGAISSHIPEDRVFSAVRSLEGQGTTFTAIDILRLLGRDRQSSESEVCSDMTEAGDLTRLDKENSALRKKLMCLLCMNKERHVVFVPCGHFNSCKVCAELVENCPECQQRIAERVHARLSI